MSASAPGPEAALPPTALPAWEAYRRMLDTKAAHFAALAEAEQAANAGLKPRLAQQAQVATLLEAHSAAVTAFREALAALDSESRSALVALLARVNEGLGAGATPSTH